MKTVQLKRMHKQDWEYVGSKPSAPLKKPLVLVFGDRLLLESTAIYEEVRELFPDGEIVIASSSANITNNMVFDGHIALTAIELEKNKVQIERTNSKEQKGSTDYEIGYRLLNTLPTTNLQFVFVLAEGSFINGSQLTSGMTTALQNETVITGGLCADATRFERTLAGYNEAPKEGEIIAIGFYGNDLEVSFSIYGGWTPFGPERIVTKSEGNVLYELDNQAALDLYKKYLGDKSKDLPASALLYPLNVTATEGEQSIVRSILNIDEANNAIILAGDIPLNAKVQLMMTNVDNIANASEKAAVMALENRATKPELAILVSCIGRKLVLDQRVEEEVDEVIEVVGPATTITGFYSYGEIAPFHGEQTCQLHNQTMTITLLSEK